MTQPISQPRAVALEARHALIEDRISKEAATPLPDAIEISRLKREKLHLRDSLAGH